MSSFAGPSNDHSPSLWPRVFLPFSWKAGPCNHRAPGQCVCMCVCARVCVHTWGSGGGGLGCLAETSPCFDEELPLGPQRAIGGLPGPRVPWLWPYCFHSGPPVTWGAAQRDPKGPRPPAAPGCCFLFWGDFRVDGHPLWVATAWGQPSVPSMTLWAPCANSTVRQLDLASVVEAAYQ